MWPRLWPRCDRGPRTPQAGATCDDYTALSIMAALRGEASVPPLCWASAIVQPAFSCLLCLGGSVNVIAGVVANHGTIRDGMAQLRASWRGQLRSRLFARSLAAVSCTPLAHPRSYATQARIATCGARRDREEAREGRRGV